jgi:hypothetical protein
LQFITSSIFYVSSNFLEKNKPHCIPCSNFNDQSESEPDDENYIQRHILDCLGALILLKRKKFTMHSLESKIFFLAVLSVASLAAEEENNGHKNMQSQAEELMMRNFPSPDYVPTKLKLEKGGITESPASPRNASHWLCMHWAGIVG